MDNWWTPELVDEFLGRYCKIYSIVHNYYGSGIDCPDAERPRGGTNKKGMHRPAPLVDAIAILIDLDRAINSLPRRDRTVAHLYWRRTRGEVEIGLRVGVSQPRISRILSRSRGNILDFLLEGVIKTRRPNDSNNRRNQQIVHQPPTPMALDQASECEVQGIIENVVSRFVPQIAGTTLERDDLIGEAWQRVLVDLKAGKMELKPAHIARHAAFAMKDAISREYRHSGSSELLT